MQADAMKPVLDADTARKIDAYWRAANYLSVGQIYLCNNPLMREPLAASDVKRMLLGHWGTTPGQNFIYTHMNRVIKKYDLDMIYMSRPRTWRSRRGRQHLPRGHLQRSVRQTSVRMRPD